jgi:hypothetical protein
MSSGGPSPPTPYDPYAVAAQQNTYNQQAAAQSFNYANQAATESLQANAINQSNPFGSLTYTQTGTGANGIPIYSATESLSPTEQALFSLYTGGQQGLGSTANKLIDATAGQYAKAPDFTGTTNSLTANMMANEVASLSPYFKTQQDALTSQLASEGIAPTQTGGSVNPAWENAEMALQGNQNQAVTGFLASAQPAAFQEAVTAYQTPLDTILKMLGASTPNYFNQAQVQTPSTNVQAPQVQPTNLEGAVATAEQAQQKTYEDQMQQYSSMLTGMFGIPTAILGGVARNPAIFAGA